MQWKVARTTMIKIAQLGSYDVNAGDNIALLNVRSNLTAKYSGKLEFHKLDITDFHNAKNDPEYCKAAFDKVNRKYDALIIGGGGLIGYGHYSDFGTDWKLPLNVEIIRSLEIPIFVYGIG